jgi:DNA adenine methylase
MDLQYDLFGAGNDISRPRVQVQPFSSQLLKWIGNKQRFAHEIISYFPSKYEEYIEPFLGSGAVLATLSPPKAVGSDLFKPLVEIFQTLQDDPQLLKDWYSHRWAKFMNGDRTAEYERIKASYNKKPNPADLVFISRSCYGGVIRFRKDDGYLSTPIGPHKPISPSSFARRVDEWQVRTSNARFVHSDFRPIMKSANAGDLVYCDPPYTHTQPILYGAQSFDLEELLESIAECKSRGVYLVLSIDGTKKSGNYICDLPIPNGLFEHEVMVNVGRSMLKRFQMNGKSLESEVVRDRLLLTY